MPTASGTAQTRFGISGWGARRAGSFAGKAASTIVWTTAGGIYLRKSWHPNYYFEVAMRAVNGGQTAYARLYDWTDAVTVAHSEISSTSATTERVRSGDVIVLKDDHEYRVQFGAVVSGDGGAFSAVLLEK